MRLGNWTDEPCYYVSVTDAGKLGLLLGPFRTHQSALDMVEDVRKHACTVNDWAAFYAFGTVKMVDGHRDGLFNNHFSPDTWTGEPLKATA